MTDRADEIQVCTRIFEESFRHGADSEYALDALRAYGDERANAALKSMNKVVDDERSARLERNPRLRREIRNAAMEEVANLIDHDPYHSSTHEELVAKVLALKEKP